jgi:hypothetical protein
VLRCGSDGSPSWEGAATQTRTGARPGSISRAAHSTPLGLWKIVIGVHAQSSRGDRGLRGLAWGTGRRKASVRGPHREVFACLSVCDHFPLSPQTRDITPTLHTSQDHIRVGKSGRIQFVKRCNAVHWLAEKNAQHSHPPIIIAASMPPSTMNSGPAQSSRDGYTGSGKQLAEFFLVRASDRREVDRHTIAWTRQL